MYPATLQLVSVCKLSLYLFPIKRKTFILKYTMFPLLCGKTTDFALYQPKFDLWYILHDALVQNCHFLAERNKLGMVKMGCTQIYACHIKSLELKSCSPLKLGIGCIVKCVYLHIPKHPTINTLRVLKSKVLIGPVGSSKCLCLCRACYRTSLKHKKKSISEMFWGICDKSCKISCSR